MHWQQRLNGLDLDNEILLHQKIESVCVIDLDIAILQRNADFTYGTQPAIFQLCRQTIPITPFKQARPQLAMHLDGRTDYFSTQLRKRFRRSLRHLCTSASLRWK